MEAGSHIDGALSQVFSEELYADSRSNGYLTLVTFALPCARVCVYTCVCMFVCVCVCVHLCVCVCALVCAWIQMRVYV